MINPQGSLRTLCNMIDDPMEIILLRNFTVIYLLKTNSVDGFVNPIGSFTLARRSVRVEESGRKKG